MLACHEQFPAYDFARHKGYPTPEHLRALARHGPCPLHRRSFAPVARCRCAAGAGDAAPSAEGG
jgi:ribonuclease HII